MNKHLSNRSLVGDLIQRVADFFPHLLKLARRNSRLGWVIAHLPWLDRLHVQHPRIAALIVYWLASIPPTLLIVLVQASGDLLAARRAGAWLWVIQGLLWLVFDSIVYGPLFMPQVLLALVWRIFSVFGSTVGFLAFVGLVAGAIKLAHWYVTMPTRSVANQAEKHARAQGRVSDKEILADLAIEQATQQVGGIHVATGAIPLGYLNGRPIGVPWTADAGHIAVVGPTRSGKGLHLTDTLIRWPGPVVCVDPKGEQWQRTAGFRQQAYGPVFRIPPQGLDLGELYDLDEDLDVRELHEVLLRPWQDGKDRIFADKALSLFTAAVKHGRTVGEHPLRVLGRWAQGSPVSALQEAAGAASTAVLVFTDGLEPERISQNRFALSSWGNFSTRYSPFSAHVATVTTTTVPKTWAVENASIYLTYPLQSQNAVGPLAAALIAGLVRQLLANPPGKRVLFAIDEMPTVGLPNLTSYLATVGGAGITLVLYAQAVPQIEDVYGHEAALSILSNCTSQLFFPPRKPHTAELISRAFGSKLELTEQMTLESTSYGSRYRPQLEPAEVMSLPEGSLIVFSRGLRHVTQDSREVVRGWLPRLPAAPAVSARADTDAVSTTLKGATDSFW